jgi:hypothetical protein
MQEMEFNNPNCSATSNVVDNYSSRIGKSATPQAMQQGFSSVAYNAAVGQAVGLSGRPGSPGAAVLASQPFVAQHNNLMGTSSSSSSTGRASPGGMSKLRDRL